MRIFSDISANIFWTYPLTYIKWCIIRKKILWALRKKKISSHQVDCRSESTKLMLDFSFTSWCLHIWDIWVIIVTYDYLVFWAALPVLPASKSDDHMNLLPDVPCDICREWSTFRKIPFSIISAFKPSEAENVFPPSLLPSRSSGIVACVFGSHAKCPGSNLG